MVRRYGAALLLCAAWIAPLKSEAEPAGRCPALLSSGIPPRMADAAPARDFVERHNGADAATREAAITAELRSGNVPGFVRSLQPIVLAERPQRGAAGEIVLCVSPDYLAIGSDADFLRVSVGLPTAMGAAVGFGFVLPTRKMVDAIYDQAGLRLTPQPLPAGDAMRSLAYLVRHDSLIAAQRTPLSAALDIVTVGHKKDLVVTNRLRAAPERVAIYGWHRPGATPIQPLSTVHGARYADYSHGVRLVSLVAYVDGRPRALIDLLADQAYATAVSDEGPITGMAALAETLTGSAATAATMTEQTQRLMRAAADAQIARGR